MFTGEIKRARSRTPLYIGLAVVAVAAAGSQARASPYKTRSTSDVVKEGERVPRRRPTLLDAPLDAALSLMLIQRHRHLLPVLLPVRGVAGLRVLQQRQRRLALRPHQRRQL